MNDLLEGMVRHPDYATSIMAATKVRKMTLRQAVLHEALRSRGHGITDDELKAIYPRTPESSVRKRRTELAQENVLLATGRVRKNRHGQEETVWMHRDFHHNPPPLMEREQPTSKAQQIVMLEARVRLLEATMREALEAHDKAGTTEFANLKMVHILTAALSA
jgi:hypothetical protein